MKHNATKFEGVGAGSVRRAHDTSRATERALAIWYGLGLLTGILLTVATFELARMTP
jgi:hypothetical protein